MPRNKKPKVPKVRLAKPKGRTWQIRYNSPVTGREVRLTTDTHDADLAAGQKKAIEAKLLLGIDPKPGKVIKAGPSMPWQQFRDEYTRLKVATMRSDAAKSQTDYCIDVCEAIMQPQTLGQMAEAASLATLQARLLAGDESKKDSRSPHTVRSYMAALIAALNWAHRPMHWLPSAIEFDLLETDDPAKGRPLCLEELEKMLAVVPKVIGTEDAAAVESWRHLLRALWESGLRLSEALALHWEEGRGIVPHLTRSGLLLLHIPGKLQKSRKAQDVPTTPAFAALLESLPSRKGWILNPTPRRGQKRLSAAQVSRIISAIGAKAKIVVSDSGKNASAHDLRRSFGQRMADAGLSPRDLQSIMRHASVLTTEQYYLKHRAQDQGERIARYLGTLATAQEASKSTDVDATPNGTR
jgi:integrase